jgi:periplasmic protein TonB
MYMSSFSDGQRAAALAAGTMLDAERIQPCTFHDPRRCSWSTLGLIALGHLVLLAALVLFDVVPIPGKPKPISLEIIPLEITPLPPAAPPPPSQKQVVQAPIVAPPPIVRTDTPPPAVTISPVPQPSPPVPAAPTTVPAAAAAPIAAPVVETGPVSLGKLSALPGNPPLKYPPSARMRHQEGVVRLRILVSTDGHVADIAIAQSSGFEVLDKAALEVVRRWRFQPPTRDGQPVEGIGIFPAAFRLAA